MEKIKIGGIYKMKNGGWLLVNKMYKGELYKCHIIDIDEDSYDEEIIDYKKNEILDIIEDINKCYVPHYSKKYGLYAISTDGSSSNKIYLFKNRRKK